MPAQSLERRGARRPDPGVGAALEARRHQIGQACEREGLVDVRVHVGTALGACEVEIEGGRQRDADLPLLQRRGEPTRVDLPRRLAAAVELERARVISERLIGGERPALLGERRRDPARGARARGAELEAPQQILERGFVVPRRAASPGGVDVRERSVLSGDDVLRPRGERPGELAGDGVLRLELRGLIEDGGGLVRASSAGEQHARLDQGPPAAALVRGRARAELGRRRGRVSEPSEPPRELRSQGRVVAELEGATRQRHRDVEADPSLGVEVREPDARLSLPREVARRLRVEQHPREMSELCAGPLAAREVAARRRP